MECEEVIIEAPCRVSASTYMRRVMSMWMSRHWWWIASLGVMCASLCTIATHWCIIAFIVSIAAMMMIMSLVYFHYAFSPLARWSVMEKSVRLSSRGIELDFEHPRMKGHCVEWESVRSIDFHSHSTVIHLAGPYINFLMLPALDASQVKHMKKLYLI